MRSFLIAVVVAFAVALPAGAARSAPPLSLPDRWLYVSTNLLVDRNVDDLQPLFLRAGRAGCTGVLLSDSKFGRLAQMDRRYFANVDRVKKLAAADHLEIIPALFELGYSESLLSQDPNLAEGLPVRDAPFVVENNEARPVPDATARLKDSSMARLARWDWHDPCVTEDNGAAKMTDPHGANARIAQKVTLQPFREYHIQVRVKTQDFQGTPEVKVLTPDGRSLVYSDLGVRRTQDWTVHHVMFNSLDSRAATVYFGAWGAGTGTVWWKDAVLEAAPLVNLVRRDGAPLTIMALPPGATTPRTLEEGRDFDRLFDPKMGNQPWSGAFDVYHVPPVIHTHGLPDGTRLAVSFYHAITVGDGQVMICPSEPKTVALLRDEARRVHAAWGAKAYFMSHDEIRVLNWDESCQRRHLTPGQIMADNVRTCINILNEVNPGGRIYVWSDMFDPNHNAHDRYYLVNGDLAGSWDGLGRDVIVAVWYRQKRAESMKFFADRGNRMIVAGYYDEPVANLRQWLDAAEALTPAGTPSLVRGTIYTTWQRHYQDLEAFERIVDDYRR